MNEKELRVLAAELIVKCIESKEYRERFIQDAKQCFSEEGYDFPKEVEIKVIESKEDELCIALPKDNPEEFVSLFFEKIRKEGRPLIPEGKKIVFVQNTEKCIHLVLPSQKTVLSEEELEAISAGGSLYYASSNLMIATDLVAVLSGVLAVAAAFGLIL